MTLAEQTFLDLVRAGIHGVPNPVCPDLSDQAWEELYALAEAQKLSALVLDAALKGKAKLPRDLLRTWQEKAVGAVIRQAVQENEFLDLLLALREKGLEPLVVKGAVCRGLYPNPLFRPSVDEDLFLPAADASACHEVLLSLGLTADDPALDPDAVSEFSYHKPNSPTYIEIHKALLDPSSPVFGQCNTFFSDSLAHAATAVCQDVTLRTLAPTDHLLFLLLHAYKHFLHSGFGLRLICDAGLFYERYQAQIDEELIFSACQQLRCQEFAAAVFQIGGEVLGLPVPPCFAALSVDPWPLLEDVLSAGLHGAEDLNRLHSSSITLQTVAAQRSGRTGKREGLGRTLFPRADALKGRFPWLQKRPWLLPLAWLCRVAAYVWMLLTNKKAKLKPSATVRIGSERIKLLKNYHIID